MMRSVALVLTLGVALLGGCRDDGNSTPSDGPITKTDGGNNTKKDFGAITETTIMDVTTGKVAAGTAVSLKGVIVTAVDTFGDYSNHAYVQDPAGGKNSGIFLFGPKVDSGQLSDLKPGDVVDVVGPVQHYRGPTGKEYNDNKVVIQIDRGIVTKTGTGAEPTPAEVTPSELTTEPDASAWSAVLVKVKNMKVRKPLDTYGQFMVDGNLQVDDEFYLHSAVKVDDCLDIVGVSIFFYSNKLNPRGAADLVPATGCQAAKSVVPSDLQDAKSANYPGDNADVKVTGIVTAVDTTASSTTSKYTNGFYIQDEGAGGPYKGIYVYHQWADTDTIKPPAVGNKVEVSGIYTEYYGLSEIKSVGAIQDLGPATAIAPITVAIADLVNSSAEYQKYQGVLVKVENVKVGELVQNTDKTITYGFKTTEGVEFNGSLFSFIGATPPALNDTYTSITGVVTQFSSSSIPAYTQVLPRSAADVVK